jgi:hypothetical protein
MLYIVTAVDYCTKWPEAAPLPNKCAISVARFVWGLMCRYGAADVHITDQGSEFQNKFDTELMRLSGVEHRVTSAYHPQANGLVERQNRTTEACLQKALEAKRNQWVYALDSVLFACRVARHATTKFTPYRLMFNRDPVIPSEHADNMLDSYLPPSDPDEHVAPDFEATVEHMEQLKADLLRKTKQNIDQAQLTQQKYYNIRHASEVLRVGDKVMKENPRGKATGRKEKGLKKLGPYTIYHVTPFGGYLLKDKYGHKAKKIITPDQVSRYFQGSQVEEVDEFATQDAIRTAGQAAEERKKKPKKPSKKTATAKSSEDYDKDYEPTTTRKKTSPATPPADDQNHPKTSTPIDEEETNPPKPKRANRLARRKKVAPVETPGNTDMEEGVENPFGNIAVSEIELDIIGDDEEDPQPPPKKRCFRDQTLETVDLQQTGETAALPIHFNPLTKPMVKEACKVMQIPFDKRINLAHVGRGKLLTVQPEVDFEASPDGNCYFNSISYLLTGREEYNATIRRMVCDYIADPRNFHKLRSYLPKPYKTGQEYITTTWMRIKGWGTEFEMFAVAQMTGHDVVCYTSFGQWQRYVGSGNSADTSTHSFYITCNGAGVGNHFNPVTRV